MRDAANVAMPDSLSKRDRQAAAMVMELARQDEAFSVLFDFSTKRGLKASLYREQPKPLWQSAHVPEGDDDENADVQNSVPPPAAAPPAAERGAQRPATPAAPPPPPREDVASKKDEPTANASNPAQKKPQVQVAKVDKNSLSARGGGDQKLKPKDVAPKKESFLDVAKKPAAAGKAPLPPPPSGGMDCAEPIAFGRPNASAVAAVPKRTHSDLADPDMQQRFRVMPGTPIAEVNKMIAEAEAVEAQARAQGRDPPPWVDRFFETLPPM